VWILAAIYPGVEHTATGNRMGNRIPAQIPAAPPTVAPHITFVISFSNDVSSLIIVKTPIFEPSSPPPKVIISLFISNNPTSLLKREAIVR
jgi:hypothetical protein